MDGLCPVRSDEQGDYCGSRWDCCVGACEEGRCVPCFEGRRPCTGDEECFRYTFRGHLSLLDGPQIPFDTLRK